MSALDPDFGIIGYTDRWTYEPGERVPLRFTAAVEASGTARLYRVGDSGLRHDRLGVAFAQVPGIEARLDIAPQKTVPGSWLVVESVRDLALRDSFTLAVNLLPTLIGEAVHGIFDWTGADAGLALSLTPGGSVLFEVRSGRDRSAAVRLDQVLAAGRWTRIAASVDGISGRLAVAAKTSDGAIRTAHGSAPAGLHLPDDGPVRLGAAPLAFMTGARSLNGRLEAPVLARSALDPADAFAALDEATNGIFPRHSSVVAAWDFSQRIDSDVAVDLGPHELHGRFVNLPTRAVKGRLWDGTEQTWRHAPRQYAAVHLHEDDLVDAGWEAAGELALPDDLKSGVYVVAADAAAGRDALPIFVRARRPGTTAKLALLLPTFTYLAYANDRCLLHGANPEVLAHRLIVLTAGDCCLAAHPEFGLSLYDTHLDGAGVIFSSTRRPCLTLRHSQRAWQGGLGARLWNFPADLLIVSWLERQGLDYEIVTDEMLDRQGPEAVAPYRCVLTGTHPEYHTGRMLDALQGYLGSGGRLVNLGGNGFYWRVATHPDVPGTIELRRAEDGNRSWAAEPGEYYHAFDGAYGGLWRRNGRPPQALVGTGYVGQGFVRCRPYRRLADSYGARVAFLFAGLEDVAIIGGFGLIGGGAAGIEIDHADPRLGTPEHALVLATADEFDDTCILANEEVLVNRPTLFGSLAPQLRADLVFFETPSGGAVLSTGSIAWAGSVADPREPNPVSRLTRNAIERFLDPASFAMP